MAAFKVNLKIDQGASFSKVVFWKTGTPAVPVDLTGCRARMQVLSKVESSAVLLEFTTENGGIVLGGATGRIEFAILTPARTALIDWLTAGYDLEIIFPDNTVQRKIGGSVGVTREFTR